jgi:hypothetical protein
VRELLKPRSSRLAWVTRLHHGRKEESKKGKEGGKEGKRKKAAVESQ